MDQRKPDLCVAIDFGTTYTGVAWLNPNRELAPTQVVSDWPGGGGAGDAGNERKVPSVLAKKPSPNGIRRWGFLCGSETPETEKWRYLKMFLEPRVLESSRRRGIAWAPKSMAEVHRLVSEYLHEVYKHIKRSISRGNGGDSNLLWDDMAIEFIFSVPTTWRGQGILNDFKNILFKAGFGVHPGHDVILGLTEAEAAAVSSMLRVGTSISFNNGDVFLSVDAGGGTTDLAFVKISSSAPPVMEQVQDVRGTGIGSMMIDLTFQQLVRRRLEKHPNLTSQLPTDLHVKLSQSPYYKTQKHKFGDPLFDRDDDSYRIEISGVRYDYSCKELGIEDGHLVIAKSEFESLFELQVTKIITLVEEGLDKFEKDGHGSVKYIILSGGLGSSEFIHQRLQEYVQRSERSSLEGTRVQMCAEPQLVVIKGLLLEHTSSILRTRIARASYGVVIREPYSTKRHFNQPQIVDIWDEKVYATEQVRWIVKKGDRIVNGRPLLATIRRNAGLTEPLSWIETIVVSHNPEGCEPNNISDPGVEKLYEVRANMTGVPPDRLVVKRKRNRSCFWRVRKEYHVCEYDVHLAVGPSGDLRFAIFYQGEMLPGSSAPEKVPIASAWETSQPEKTEGSNAQSWSSGSWGSTITRASASESDRLRPQFSRVSLRSYRS
ncbi:hypothetical protein QBC47DRAFT_410878 [Echria macrotheca]|uniref:Actin-like ATPase domain-containing protein n=1 Tax=Echria macrotheca TaxID=438768 RepID=A0AAJ0BH67_9PEZI|nr:hypothetical protein QBC47DRAFT_410878 [Echria macrotheca]